MMRSTGSRSTKITDNATHERARLDTPRRLFCWADPLLAATHRLSAVRRPILLPAISLPARPGLLLLAALLLSLFCLVLTIPRRPPSGAAIEFALLSDRSFSNLNNTSAEAPIRSQVPQTEEGSPDTIGTDSASGGPPPAMPLVRE